MPAGRPTDLTPEVIEDVRRLLPTVLYVETVADYIGVDRGTVGDWLRRGAREAKRLRKKPDASPDPKESIFVEFHRTYKKALAEGQIYAMGVIKKASAKHWQAAAWLMERRHPDRWGTDRKVIAGLLKDIEELKRALPPAPADESGRRTPEGATS